VSAIVLAVTAALALTAWQTQSPAPGAQPRAWSQKWVYEDVVYIIANDERNAFLTLTTDDERRKFIDQFWERRDPTPGTADTEFKDEHYRRIGFVNGRFASLSGLPGWKTDRGRIYIQYGPPDEIDSHPSGDASRAFPFEDWTYRHLTGIGDNVHVDFTDTDRSGEFHQSRDPSRN
jgi:GWxTD domain-containing protein